MKLNQGFWTWGVLSNISFIYKDMDNVYPFYLLKLRFTHKQKYKLYL